MSVASDDGATLFGKSDNPLNTAAGMANEVVNNGYTLTTMIGDLAYAECVAAANSSLVLFPRSMSHWNHRLRAVHRQLIACVCAVCAADTSVSALHPALAFFIVPLVSVFSGWVADSEFHAGYWDVYMNQTQQFTAYGPHLTADGNHERDWPSSGAHVSPARPFLFGCISVASPLEGVCAVLQVITSHQTLDRMPQWAPTAFAQRAASPLSWPATLAGSAAASQAPATIFPASRPSRLQLPRPPALTSKSGIPTITVSPQAMPLGMLT